MSTTADNPEENLTETDGFNRSVLDINPNEEYEMNKKRRGLALIFNFELNLDDGRGSEADCSNLKERLTELGFEVKDFTDLSKDRVMDKIDEAAKADHSDADCFLVVFLSHGEGDHGSANVKDVTVKDVTVKDITVKDITVKDITDRFKGTKCKSLVGKPKIVIWQACRGKEYDDPVTPCAAPDTETTEVDARAVYTLPAAADFIVCYSVAEGYRSHQNTESGSWYIQDLCELLQTYGNSVEFTELLTLVNRKVSMRSVESNDPEVEGKKQVPCFASMLTKKLYFKKK